MSINVPTFSPSFKKILLVGLISSALCSCMDNRNYHEELDEEEKYLNGGDPYKPQTHEEWMKLKEARGHFNPENYVEEPIRTIMETDGIDSFEDESNDSLNVVN